MTDSRRVVVTPPANYPSWLRGVITACAVLHDLAILVAAVGAYQFTPPSVRAALGTLDWVWIAMLTLGACLGLFGSLARKTVPELVGVTLMAFGMWTWAVSAITQPNYSLVTISVAASFFAGGFAVAWRGYGILVGTYLRARK